MANRRGFLFGLLATGLCPQPSWADAGNPAFLAAAMEADGRFVLCGLRETGEIAFRLNTDDLVIAGPDHALRVAGDPDTPAIYLHARRGCEARLNRSTYTQLAEIALESGGDDWIVSSQGALFSLRG